MHTVYEAGPTGYWLHDALEEAGFDSMVTPPSLVPRIGGKVETDRRDRKAELKPSNSLPHRNIAGQALTPLFEKREGNG